MLAIVTCAAAHAEALTALLDAPRPVDAHGVEGRAGRLGDIPVAVFALGVGRAGTAFALSRVLLQRPRAVIQVGTAVAYPGTARPGAVATATMDTYADLGAQPGNGGDGLVDAATLGLRVAPGAPGQTFLADRRLVDAFVARGAEPGPFLTVETATTAPDRAQALRRRWGPALVESREGAAAAHCCLLEATPFAQLRGVVGVVGGDPGDPTQAWEATVRALRAGLPAAARAAADPVT